MTVRRMLLLAAAFATLAVSCAGRANAAEPYPSRPLRIVVGFTPGTTTDITARLLADRMSERIGQNVVVENRPGANSGLANQLVGKASPDGHTLLLGTLSLVTGDLLYRQLPFDPKDFAPVSLVVLASNVICVYPGMKAQTLGDLIRLAKAQPGKIRYGSSGRGSSAFLTLELLNSMAGVQMQEIPYKATSQAVTDTMAGGIEVYPPNVVSAIPMLKTGRLRPLAVTGTKRVAPLPDVPTVAEFVPGYDATTGVYGILVPAATPRAVVDKLSAEVTASIRDPKVRDRLEGDGGEVVGGTPREYADYLAAQRRKWAGLFDRLGVKPQ